MKIANKNVLVIGVAKSGYSAVNMLVAQGASAFVFDKDFERAQAIIKYKLVEDSVTPIKKITRKFLKGIDLVVISPGVAIKNKQVMLAKKMGIEVIGELELGYRIVKCPLYAITGTNGKTTTTEMLGAIFRQAKYVTHVVGNVGNPITAVAVESRKSDISVCEVSSYQLESTSNFHAYGVGVTNIEPDHLERHGNMQNYINTKLKIFANSTKTDFAVLNADDEVVSRFTEKLICRKYFFSLNRPIQGVYLKDGKVVFCEGKKITTLFDADSLKVLGRHNLANAMLASAMAFLAGITPEVIASALANFGGVAHRLEFVKKINGVDFYNDSKATNPSSTLVAVSAFEVPILLILGGSDKGADFRGMFRQLPNNVRAIFVCGDTKKSIMDAAKKEGFLAIEGVADLEEAVLRATGLAKQNEVILLSPACASFDAFNNYEHRGEVFKALVQELE